MRAILLPTVMLMPLAAGGADGGGIGYPTVAAALEALKSKSGATLSLQGGWTIVNDSASNAIWSFPPLDHPAYPATHCGYLVWRTQDDGSFQLVREEQNVIDKVTAQKIKPDELARLRTQFGCKD